MTARNSLKRLIRARMRKTGESYSSARRYFHTEDNDMTNETNIKLQPNLWPDWVDEHPWLVSFLASAEQEARNRGDARCDHFHMELAFLGLGPPVSDWLGTLGLDVRTLREDTVDMLGRNAKQVLGAAGLEADLARSQRAHGARESSNPVDEFPLTSVDEIYTGELLELARAEANLHSVSIDERHFLIALAMLLFEGSPPAASALRYLTGLSRIEDASFDIRAGDTTDWVRDLARSHGAEIGSFPYEITNPSGPA
ncbi:MAG: hypothetical protein F4X98_01850 [Gammaproteobacteria bacterium]|nr:hypothetical protein [Gammaproteobacteria bacterium]